MNKHCCDRIALLFNQGVYSIVSAGDLLLSCSQSELPEGKLQILTAKGQEIAEVFSHYTNQIYYNYKNVRHWSAKHLNVTHIKEDQTEKLMCATLLMKFILFLFIRSSSDIASESIF